MSLTATTKPITGAKTAASKAQAIAAIVIGGMFIYFIGFSHMSTVHNAAHDTRHSSAFPCH